MVRWKFKSCPRCGGDLFIDREVDGLYEQCLQCGYLHPLPNKVAVRNSHEPKEEAITIPWPGPGRKTDAVFEVIKDRVSAANSPL